MKSRLAGGLSHFILYANASGGIIEAGIACRCGTAFCSMQHIVTVNIVVRSTHPMTHIADLATCDYIPLSDTQRLIAIGWLHPDHGYQRGPVDHEFVVALADLLRNPWSPGGFMGRHECEFCPHSWGPDTFRLKNSNDAVDIGVNNLFVPGNGIVYVAPSMIIHYLDAHEYCPPIEFQRAVMACPEMRSMDYLKLLIANGPKGIATFGRTS